MHGNMNVKDYNNYGGLICGLYVGKAQ